MDCIPSELVTGNYSELGLDYSWLTVHTGYNVNTFTTNDTYHTFTTNHTYHTFTTNVSNSTSPPLTTPPAIFTPRHPSSLLRLENFLYSRVIVIICVFGVIGNILNLLVLTRKGLQKHMDRMERSAHYGLVALALSDMLFCVAVIPNAWVDKHQFHYHSRSFNMYYKLYGDSFINAFIMSSTWLTVAMATSRYLAICHPLRARDIIGMTFAKLSIVSVFILCVLFNLPRFWGESVESMECVGGWSVYFPVPGPLKRSPSAETIYMWLYFVFGILVPLIALAFCNVNLIRALQRSTKMRRQYQKESVTGGSRDATSHITLTLIIIVIMYFLLVVPAEAINFIKHVIIEKHSATDTFNVGNAVVNTLQAVNFACNFILYCAVNVHFRRTLLHLFCWRCLRKDGGQLGQQYESVTLSQTGYTRNTAISEF